MSLGRPSPGARVWCLNRVPKHRNQWQEVEGLLFSPQKLWVGAYFELLFLGCGFLIHLSNRYDSRRFGAPKTLSWCIFWAFVPRLWFPYSSFQQVRQPLILSPVEEDTLKIRDTTGTVFIQGPSIVLPVWRCIMFNGSYLRACMKLRIVEKIRFSLLESGRTKAWCPDLVSRPSAKA